VRDENDPQSLGMTNGDLSGLFIGVAWVLVGHRLRVEEDRRRLLERNAVLAQVRVCLLPIPLIEQGGSYLSLETTLAAPGCYLKCRNRAAQGSKAWAARHAQRVRRSPAGSKAAWQVERQVRCNIPTDRLRVDALIEATEIVP